jgi:hypothetical protein
VLTDGALRYLRSLRFDPGATRHVSFIPLGGIFWSDELPHPSALLDLPRADKTLVYRLFGIRQRIWADEALADSEQALWHYAKAQAPDCPILLRLTPSPEELRLQRDAEKAADDFVSVLRSEADEFESTPEGTFSATFDLTKNDPDKRGNES